MIELIILYITTKANLVCSLNMLDMLDSLALVNGWKTDGTQSRKLNNALKDILILSWSMISF